jgi:hypothetical protein
VADKNNGGPAFPTDNYYDEKRYGVRDGMTLRDYFAAHAPTLNQKSFEQGESALRIDAARAWRWADALLAERDK